MVIARGGSVTGKDGKALKKTELQKIVRAYLSTEKAKPQTAVYFNRRRESNGLFANIDTSERKTVPQIVDQLVRCSEFEDSLHRFFVQV